MIDIEKLLRQNTAVDDYRVVTHHRTSYEVFFVHDRLETVRATDTVGMEVTVYVRHDGKLGDSVFDLHSAADETTAAAKVQAAVERARLVYNEPYELPAGASERIELPSNLTGADQAAMAARVAEAVFAGNSFEHGSINAAEIFLYHDVMNVKNSCGVDKTEDKHTIMIEAIPTWNEGDTSVELYENVRYMDFDAAAITKELAQKMCEVRDRQIAEKPQTPMTCAVALNAKEINRLLRSVCNQLNYGNVYSHANLYKLGDDVQSDAVGDRLTITMAGAVPGCADSAAFDADGVRLGEKVLVDAGVVQGYHGSHRYAQYLGEKDATGVMNCVKLTPGSMTGAQLEAMPYLEIVSMSGMQVDLYNDYIGGEIRLAYWHENGEVKPMTGITMSAGLKEVLRSLRLSTAMTTQGSYQGPDKLLMQGVKVL